MIDNADIYRLLKAKQSFTLILHTEATSLTRDESIIESKTYDR